MRKDKKFCANMTPIPKKSVILLLNDPPLNSMALSLKAEQKNISKLFGSEDVFAIPKYQRAYSWDYEQCDQLYKDITDSYNIREDYFLGNIILARGEDNEDRPNIVDGQQRLITLYLILKVLSILCPSLVKHRRLLFVDNSRGETMSPRIESEIYDSSDDFEIKRISELTLSDSEMLLAERQGKYLLLFDRCKSRIEYNYLLFFKWFKEFYDRAGQEAVDDFMEYFVKKLYLLPIELEGPTLDVASQRALVIFETINNRGLNLEDADIIKAKLYDRAKQIGQQDDFARKWGELNQECAALGISVDDLFRYYYHILRGKERIVSPEKKLRDYFIKDKLSPLNIYDYGVVLSELNKIIGILQYINKLGAEQTELSNWIKLLLAYSNLYPRYAIVAYLYANDSYGLDISHFRDFLIDMTRFVYGRGSTTTIKFEIYNIIRDLCNNAPIPRHHIDESYGDVLSWKRISSLRRGFCMLALMLTKEGYALPADFNIERIVPAGELAEESLGNSILISCPQSRGPWSKRMSKYNSMMELDPVLLSQFNIEAKDVNQLIAKRDEMIYPALKNFFYKDLSK